MNDHGELDAGIPIQRPDRHSFKLDPDPNMEDRQPASRQYVGDDELAGVPVQRPVARRKVDSLTEKVFDDLGEEYDEVEDRGLGITQLFSSPLLSAALVLLATGILIVILSELFQFIQAVQAAPFAVQVVAYVCIFLLAIAFCIAFTRLALTYRRLSVTPQVDLGAIQQARLRAVTRKQITRQVEAGYKSLRTIVETYPISESKHHKLLARCGMKPDEVKTLQSNIDNLLKSENLGPSKFLEDCDRLFVSVIDNAAKRRVTSYAKRVGLKTAISPTGLVDSLIVLTNAVLMVEELCRLYGVRTGRWQSVLLTGRIFFSTFISAKLEERIDEIADSLFEGALSSVPQLSKELFARMSMGLLKRAAEGSVNMALFYRLGTATLLTLRPISLPAKSGSESV